MALTCEPVKGFSRGTLTVHRESGKVLMVPKSKPIDKGMATEETPIEKMKIQFAIDSTVLSSSAQISFLSHSPQGD